LVLIREALGLSKSSCRIATAASEKVHAASIVILTILLYGLWVAAEQVHQVSTILRSARFRWLALRGTATNIEIKHVLLLALLLFLLLSLTCHISKIKVVDVVCASLAALVGCKFLEAKTNVEIVIVFLVTTLILLTLPPLFFLLGCLL
jgi:hypothetical protein